MENEQNEVPEALPGKKELKHQLADKLHTALPELREILGDKKFSHRVKKAAKLLMEGLHNADVAKKGKQSPKKAIPKKVATKEKAAQNAPVSKTAGNKTAIKKAAAKKIATAKTATASKKAKSGKL